MTDKAVKKTAARTAAAPKKRGRPKKAIALESAKLAEEAQPIPKPATPAKVVATEEVAATKKPQNRGRYHYAIGRRKSALAKIRIFEDTSDISINKRPFGAYFAHKDLQKTALSPLSLLGLEKRLGFEVFVSGGGLHAQSEAVRHGIARALVVRNPEDKPLLKKAGFLTRDPRVKERKKPGLRRARRGPQWAKR